MGYGIILSSDDALLREQLATDPEQAAADLRTVLGTDSYPMTDRGTRCGAWERVTSLHTSKPTALALTADSLQVAACDDDGWFIPVLPAHRVRELERDVLARPHRHLPVVAAVQSGGDWVSAAFGPDLTGQSMRSAWWVYADSLPWPAADNEHLAALAVALGQLLESRQWDGFPVPGVRVVGAMQRVGAIGPGGGACALYWSGNRMARFEDLLPDEQRRLAH